MLHKLHNTTLELAKQNVLPKKFIFLNTRKVAHMTHNVFMAVFTGKLGLPSFSKF